MQPRSATGPVAPIRPVRIAYPLAAPTTISIMPKARVTRGRILAGGFRAASREPGEWSYPPSDRGLGRSSGESPGHEIPPGGAGQVQAAIQLEPALVAGRAGAPLL